ncbi:DNA kinase/phosphatase Pnk1, variant 2 [Entomophthora muscae]|uniref:DNA kinase/phosphatase Pnk1, variant 2 n=2 Tax=Entomophthora muscae TaxID=34485 RepID=A0ACC2US20_9FUNG|nr:DNA kinase/phosphatase Pnk1, variant 2 [Entomophthora muscae]
MDQFKTKIQQISNQLKLPFVLMASLEKDRYRKPCMGMWEHLEKLCGRCLDRSKSIFVGDAAGRPATSVPKKKKDFSDTDRKLALNIGLNFFTPEEFFLSQPPQEYILSGFDAKAYLNDLKQKNQLSKPTIQPANCQELVLMVGLPGSGKTSAFKRFLKPHDYEWINNDTLKTKETCLKATESYLTSKKSVVIDNTNLDSATRKLYIDLAIKFKAQVRCFVFSMEFRLCKHNALFRSNSLCPSLVNGKPIAAIPDVVFNTFLRKYQQPDVKEGIDSIKSVPFIPLFSSEWSKSELSPEQQEKEWTLHYF